MSNYFSLKTKRCIKCKKALTRHEKIITGHVVGETMGSSQNTIYAEVAILASFCSYDCLEQSACDTNGRYGDWESWMGIDTSH